MKQNPKYWQSKEFKILLRLWDDKLAENGFEDAEESVKGSKWLKQRASNVYRQADATTIAAKENYFTLMQQHFAKERFRSPLHRAVMTHVINGEFPREIVKRLKAMGKHIDRHTVTFIRRRYENKWGIISWTPEKMDLVPTK